MLPKGFLALPTAGGNTTPSLFRKLGLRVLGSLLQPVQADVSRTVAGALPRVQQLIAELARQDRAAVLNALRSPDVVAPVLAQESGLIDRDDAVRAAVPALLAGLSDALGELVLWDVPVASVLGHRFDPPSQGLMAGNGIREVRYHNGTTAAIESRHERVTDEIELAASDTNPLAHIEDHPDKTGNALHLGERSAKQWCDQIRAALGLIGAALPELRAELHTTLARIVPVGFEPQKHLSASYREAPGLIYMTLHPSPLTMAEAIVHETQHGKLNALTWFDPVLENAHSEWTTSPVRPDIRPLMGVLLAAHAFVPVAALHTRLHELQHPVAQGEQFVRRRAEVLAVNATSLSTLSEKAKPTKTGTRVLAALARLHDSVQSA